jgi:hypothetical protein
MAILLDRQRVKICVLCDMLEAGSEILGPFVLEVGSDLLARQEKASVWCKVTWTRTTKRIGKNVFVHLNLKLGRKRLEAEILGWSGHSMW